jgi:hypothetical protein
MELSLPTVLASAGPRAAQLITDGLSVFCFNRGGRYWEVAYPRQARHDLEIFIQRLDGNDQEVGPRLRFPVSRDIISFDIWVTDGSVSSPANFPEGGPFNRNFVRDGTGADPHDLQWMIDLAGNELNHGNFLGLKSNRPITLARIHHSLFCTFGTEEQPAVISPRGANRPNHPDSFPLGRTNAQIVGVLLAGDSGSIHFESNPPGLLNIGPLDHNQGQRYQIEIINEDIDDQPQVQQFVRGDLHLLYDDVINVDGQERELWAMPRDNAEVPANGDCHGTRFSGASLGQLII